MSDTTSDTSPVAAPASAGTGGETSAPSDAGVASPTRVNRRKIKEGLIVSNSMTNTVVVAIIERVRHPRYAKTMQRTKRFYADDPSNELRVGDRVRIQETRPISKLKRWRVVEVLERAK